MPEKQEERFSVTVAGAGTLAFTVTDAAHLPGAGGGGVALGWPRYCRWRYWRLLPAGRC